MSQTISAKKQTDPAVHEMEFEEIFEQYHRPIYYYLFRMTQNTDITQDLTQETFVRVHKGLSGFRSESAVSTWIYRIATNVALDYQRGRSAKQDKASVPLDEEEIYASLIPDRDVNAPELAASQSEMSECVQRVTRNLPPNYRAPLILSDLEGLSNKEIAQIMELPLSTVKMRLHRARRRLQATLEAGCNFSRDERNVLVCEEKEGGDSGSASGSS